MENIQKQWYQKGWIWGVVILIIFIFFYSKSNKKESACTDAQLIELQNSLGISREAALKQCEEWDKFTK